MNNIEILENYVEEWHDTDLAEAIKELIQENKELKEKQKELYSENLKLNSEIASSVYWLSTPTKDIEKQYIPKSKVKEKMQKDIKINEHVILGGRRNGKTLEYGKRLGRIEMCEELLKEGE